MKYFAGIPYPDEVAGVDLMHYEAVLSALGIGVFLWDGGDSIGWDNRSRAMYGLPIDDGKRFVQIPYSQWAAMPVSKAEFELAQQTAINAMATGHIYMSTTRYQPPACSEVLAIGVPVDVRERVRGLWGVQIPIVTGVSESVVDVVERAHLARRLYQLTAETKRVADRAEGAL